MHFTIEHRFPAAPTRVAALMVDPDFEGAVQLPDLSLPEVVEHDTDSDAHVLKLRYEYVGQLDPMAKRLLAGRQLALVQTVRIDPDTGLGTLTIEAEADPDRLHGNARITLAADGTVGGDASVRALDGEFVVKVPVIGRTIERKLLPGILARLDVEADALVAHLRANG
jgi:Protein of unknown function (DUF2505)